MRPRFSGSALNRCLAQQIVYLETPSNPTMKIADLKAVVTTCRRHSDIIIVCDNTFMSPYFQVRWLMSIPASQTPGPSVQKHKQRFPR